MTRHHMAAALCAGFAAPPAAAQMYLGLGAGAARTDTHQTSYKLYGGYQFSPNWGLELGYNDLGRYLGARSESWTLAGTGTLPVTNNWSLLGKLGVAANRTEFSGGGGVGGAAAAAPPRFSGTARENDLLVGVGIGYSFNRNVGLRLEYEDFGKLSDVASGNNSRGNNLGLSVKYLF